MADTGMALVQAQSVDAQADYQKQQYNFNATLAEEQGKDAIKRGDVAAKDYNKKIKGVIGSQRAAMAAQGVDISDGSALEIQEDTAAIGAQDMLTIKNNAWREAWGYKVNVSNLKGQAAFAGIAAQTQNRNNILSGLISDGKSGANAAATGGK